MVDRIDLEDLRIECIVGILDRERVQPQPLVVSVELELDLDRAGNTGDLAAAVDYAAVMHQLRFLAMAAQFRLIESFSVASARLLLAPPGPGEARAQVQAVGLSVKKPGILGGLAVPGVRVRRTAEGAPPQPRPDDPRRQALVGVVEVTVERWCLRPGERIDGGDRAQVLLLGGDAFSESGVLCLLEGDHARTVTGDGPDGATVLWVKKNPAK